AIEADRPAQPRERGPVGVGYREQRGYAVTVGGQLLVDLDCLDRGLGTRTAGRRRRIRILGLALDRLVPQGHWPGRQEKRQVGWAPRVRAGSRAAFRAVSRAALRV